MFVHMNRVVFNRPDEQGHENPFDANDHDFEDAINRALGDEDTTSTDEGDTSQQTADGQQSDTTQTQQTTGEQDQEGSDPNKLTPEQQAQQEQQNKDQNTGNTGDIKFNDGSVISGGIARRVFGRAKRAEDQYNQIQQQYQQVQTELNQAKQQVQAYEQANHTQRELGISPNDAVNAYKVLDAYKKNPAQAINYLIQAAKSQGKDLSQLGIGVDTSAIKSMIDEAIKPFRDQTQQQQEQQQVQQRAQQEADQFLGNNPKAQVHVDTIAKILQNEPGTTLNEAWLKVQNYYYRNGLDLNTPLSKIAEQRANPQQQTQQTQHTGPSTQAPRQVQPNITTGNQSSRNYTPSKNVAPSSQDWDAIIGESLSGVQFGE